MKDGEESESSEDEERQARRGRAANGQTRDRAAEKEKARDRLMADIANAAGGPLAGLL